MALHNYATRIILRDDDLTEAGIENALDGWEDWLEVE
jgi:hypothetical protein